MPGRGHLCYNFYMTKREIYCENDHTEPTLATKVLSTPGSTSAANATFACDACAAESKAWHDELGEDLAIDDL